MNLLKEMIIKVGKKKFQKCANLLKNYAPKTGYAKHINDPMPNDSIIHDITKKINDLGLHYHSKIHTKLKLLISLYELSPCYIIQMNIRFLSKYFSPASNRYFWRKCRYWLTSDKALSRPFEYSLWCDWFEDPKTVSISWKMLFKKPWGENMISRILHIAGPVPWNLKYPLLMKLIKQKAYHNDIFQCLVFSDNDILGAINIKEAITIIKKLDMSLIIDNKNYFKLKYNL